MLPARNNTKIQTRSFDKNEKYLLSTVFRYFFPALVTFRKCETVTVEFENFMFYPTELIRNDGSILEYRYCSIRYFNGSILDDYITFDPQDRLCSSNIDISS